MAKTIIELDDFSLRKDTLYEIKQKYDADAPEGFRQYETTKALMDDVSNSEAVAIFNEYIRAWDNGLFLESPLLTAAVPDETARKLVLESLEENIVKPIESVRGKGALDNKESNNEFWDNFTVTLNVGRVFNTADPMQALQLYNLLLRKVVTPKDLENHPAYRGSQFTIIDKELSVSKAAEKSERDIKSAGLYYQLKTTNREALIAILNYIGLNVKESDTDSNIDFLFKRFLEDKNNGVQNTKEFIEVSENYTTPKGKQLIGTFQKLRELYSEGSIELRGKDYYLGEYNLGNTFKLASKTVVSDKDIKKAFSELLK